MRIGSLCSGYGGLDAGVQSVLGGSVAWVSDIDKGANKILAHRYAGVPNLGDFTTTDWSAVEPVDVLTAGFPCQPVSHVGRRLGDEDERWLWDDVARAVGELRPGIVVLENVRGLLTAGAGRLFGRVLGSLANLGYDAQWHGLRAADVGAPHERFRVFIIAHPAGAPNLDTRQAGESGDRGVLTLYAPARSQVGALLHLTRFIRAETSTAVCGISVGTAGQGRPLSEFTDWPNDYCSRCLTAATGTEGVLLPTPTARDWKNVGNPDRTAARMAARGQPLSEVVVNHLLPSATLGNPWGDYAAAIARWETVLGRPAPPPTMTSAKGNPQLSPRFVEWMMGLPAGWVTDVPGITRNEALRALGNGVVPQQCAAALRLMLGQAVAA